MALTKVITRFPPSPTGFFQVGNARTALFNYYFAKQQGGSIILRFEDTDRARSTKESEDDFFQGLEWLGLRFDAVYRQSERGLIYRRYLEKLVAEDKAYISDEIPKEAAHGEDSDEEGEWRESFSGKKEIIRFRNPKKVVTFTDEVRGEISVDTTELGDFVIAKSLEEPLYHLGVVIDDFEMGVTHVIRGDDGIYNTPRQILIQDAIGAPRPIYCHVPFILGKDKKKLSKRHGTGAVRDLREKGYLPEALVNYLSLLGWNPGTAEEVFSFEELIQKFDFTHLQKAPAVFDIEKLNWFNREYLKKIPDEQFGKMVLAQVPQLATHPGFVGERFAKIIPLLKERVTVLSDLNALYTDGELTYFFEAPAVDASSLIPKDTTRGAVLGHLTHIMTTLETLSEWSSETVRGVLWDYATEKGRGAVLWPMRYALSGRMKSPDPFALSHVLGKEETIERIKSAVALLTPA